MSSILQKVKAVQDESSHWYIIPLDSYQEFLNDANDYELCESGKFDDKWGKYRTGGDLNLVQLWAEIKG